MGLYIYIYIYTHIYIYPLYCPVATISIDLLASTFRNSEVGASRWKNTSSGKHGEREDHFEQVMSYSYGGRIYLYIELWKPFFDRYRGWAQKNSTSSPLREPRGLLEAFENNYSNSHMRLITQSPQRATTSKRKLIYHMKVRDECI